MAKITLVEPQKKTLRLVRQSSPQVRSGQGPKRFNVFLDGEFAFGADEDLVVNRRLVVGKIIAPEDMEKILFEAEVGKLMEKIYRWFSLRQHSEREVREYFRIKNQESRIKEKEGISQLVIDATVETLKRKGLINDLEFAKSWVEARRKSKQKGIRAIKAELFQKGIDKEIIEEVLRLSFDFAQDRSGQVSEEELAKLALEKKMKHWKNLPPLEFKKKAYEFLMRKGFDYEIIRKAIGSFKNTVFQ